MHDPGPGRSFGRTPPDARRAVWLAGAAPRAMLAELRSHLLRDGGSELTPARQQALRAFALRCARQRPEASDGSGAGTASEFATHLVAVAAGVSGGSVSERDAAAARLLGAAVARRATERLADPARRRGAAVLLAAFHALDPDPYGAALLASGMVERYGAASEADVRAIRAEQGAWLQELFGMDALEDPPARPLPPPPAGPWTSDGKWAPEQAARMRYLLRYREALLAVDPWLAVPQQSCSFTFGVAERPLPIGALCLLWDGWDGAAGDCPECGGRVLAYALGGASRVGGVVGCCLTCERELRRELGGARAVARAVAPVLEGTEYEVSGVRGHYMQPWVVGEPEGFDAAVAGIVAREVMEEVPE